MFRSCHPHSELLECDLDTLRAAIWPSPCTANEQQVVLLPLAAETAHAGDCIRRPTEGASLQYLSCHRRVHRLSG